MVVEDEASLELERLARRSQLRLVAFLALWTLVLAVAALVVVGTLALTSTSTKEAKPPAKTR